MRIQGCPGLDATRPWVNSAASKQGEMKALHQRGRGLNRFKKVQSLVWLFKQKRNILANMFSVWIGGDHDQLWLTTVEVISNKHVMLHTFDLIMDEPLVSEMPRMCDWSLRSTLACKITKWAEREITQWSLVSNKLTNEIATAWQKATKLSNASPVSSSKPPLVSWMPQDGQMKSLLVNVTSFQNMKVCYKWHINL